MDFIIDYEQYSVIGDPIYHSISPFMHGIIFNYFNEKNKIYSRLRITSDGLVYNFSMLKSNFQGFNVTSPHKVNIIKYLDELDEFAKKIGCVNTVKILNGKSYGYNTDAYGFLMSLKDYRDKIKGKDILVLGSGATSRIVISTLIDLGANVYVCARNFDKLVNLKKFIEDIHNGYEINISVIDKMQGSYFGIINTTSAVTKFNISNLSIQEFAYDLNYSTKGATNFLSMFLDKGIELIDGRDMLFYQAILAQEIWRDIKFNECDISNIYDKFIKIFSEE